MLADAKHLLRHRSFRHLLDGYGTLYAACVLHDLSPARLVSAAEEIWNAIPEEERKNDSAGSMQTGIAVLLHILSALLDHLNQLPTAKAMAQARLPLFRALVAQHALHTSLQEGLETRLALLRRLAGEEQVEALAEWVGDVRVEANRNGYRENEQIRTRRLWLFDELVAVWPAHMDSTMLRRIAARLGGPIEGSWALSTTEDLFARLVSDAKLAWDEIESLWFQLLDEHLTPLLTGKGARHHFSLPSDGSLTHAFTQSLIRCDPELRDRRRHWLARSSDAAARTLGMPFIRSRNHKRWDEACSGIEWAMSLVLLLCAQGKGVLPLEEQRSWEDLLASWDRLLAPFREKREQEQGEATAREFMRRVKAALPK